MDGGGFYFRFFLTICKGGERLAFESIPILTRNQVVHARHDVGGRSNESEFAVSETGARNADDFTSQGQATVKGESMIGTRENEDAPPSGRMEGVE